MRAPTLKELIQLYDLETRHQITAHQYDVILELWCSRGMSGAVLEVQS